MLDTLTERLKDPNVRIQDLQKVFDTFFGKYNINNCEILISQCLL